MAYAQWIISHSIRKYAGARPTTSRWGNCAHPLKRVAFCQHWVAAIAFPCVPNWDVCWYHSLAVTIYWPRGSFWAETTPKPSHILKTTLRSKLNPEHLTHSTLKSISVWGFPGYLERWFLNKILSCYPLPFINSYLTNYQKSVRSCLYQ